jgi:hypothetical protein
VGISLRLPLTGGHHGCRRDRTAGPAAANGAAIEIHFPLAFEHAFRLGEKRVSTEIVEQVLSRAIDELEPTLTRNGYDTPALIVLLQAKPADVRDFLAGTLAVNRTREFTELLRVAGVPV